MSRSRYSRPSSSAIGNAADQNPEPGSVVRQRLDMTQCYLSPTEGAVDCGSTLEDSTSRRGLEHPVNAVLDYPSGSLVVFVNPASFSR